MLRVLLMLLVDETHILSPPMVQWIQKHLLPCLCTSSGDDAMTNDNDTSNIAGVADGRVDVFRLVHHSPFTFFGFASEFSKIVSQAWM